MLQQKRVIFVGEIKLKYHSHMYLQKNHVRISGPVIQSFYYRSVYYCFI